MCQSLPYTKFKWVENEYVVSNFDTSVIASNSPTDYILEVNLEYPFARPTN